ncbi:MAG TPA: acyl-CoA carboxylase epsilon subunit [Acidimicrobiia bacterium]|nr:acyl-CoA carboxylase epsilon subunit [Acidimicrobiia bacterium]
MATHLRSINPDATPEEVAAIVAALAASVASRAGADVTVPDDGLHEWVRAARVRSRRAGLQRGPWRLSGRVGRRDRA